jgi:hypothetical protein
MLTRRLAAIKQSRIVALMAQLPGLFRSALPRTSWIAWEHCLMEPPEAFRKMGGLMVYFTHHGQ